MKKRTDTLPDDLRGLLNKLVDQVRESLENEVHLCTSWFLVHRPSNRLIPIGLPADCEWLKEEAGTAIRQIILDVRPKPDCVIFISVAWQTIVPDGHLDMEQLALTPVRDTPGAKHVVSFVVETRDGIWVAGPELEQTETRTTFGEVVWQRVEMQMGPLFGYLPPDKSQIN
jgi:hypothetical protein